MICLLLKKSSLRNDLARDLKKHQVAYKIIEPDAPDSLAELYSLEFEALAYVVEDQHPALPGNGWLDCITSLCRRTPVIVVSKDEQNSMIMHYGPCELLTWARKPTSSEILNSLDASGSLGLENRIMVRNAIPIYNQMLSFHMLRQNGSLSILTIHAGDFRKVATEYGAEAYLQLQDCFQQILMELWGVSGSFRKNDILCRKTPHSNTYYILLEQSRSQQSIPPPGALEKLSDRVATKIQCKLWEELFKGPGERILPTFLHDIPGFSIGHATALANPCVDFEETIDSLVESSQQMARVQMKRIQNRQREHIQALIQTRGILVPNFQAVFDVSKITIEQVKKSTETKSIKPLKNGIFGFESLIRVNEAQADMILSDEGPIYIESRFLRPDILFSMASRIHLSLELDQACLRVASNYFQGLPGKLFANILPRNFYYVEKLQQLLNPDVDLTFEVSESEAINNFELLLKTKTSLAKKNYGIAIDDFGKGYAGLDRILKIKPDVIKLDRCLIQNIHKDSPKKAFVSGVIKAARITNSFVLAEGVESIDEMKCLKDLGIDLIQGFLLHRPQNVQDLKKDLGLSGELLEPVA